MKTKWPETVPYFYSTMCCKGVGKRDQRLCAVMWLQKMFGWPGSGSEAAATSARELERIIGGGIVPWNDAPERTLQEIADALNKLTDNFGWTVPIYSKD